MVKSARARLKTDAKAETEGREFEFDNNVLLIARAGGRNQAYHKAAAELSAKHRKDIEAGQITGEEATRMAAELMAKTCVKSWATIVEDEKTGKPVEKPGIEAEDGSILEDTIENRIAYFVDVPDFLAEVNAFANNYAFYRANLAEGVAKN